MKSTLVYIAGYIAKKEESNANDTFDYVKNFWRFTFGLDRGGLNAPGDSIREWLCFCYSIFYSVVKDVCRNSLCDIFWTLLKDSCLR